MKLKAPNGSTVTFGTQTSDIVVRGVSFDLSSGTYTVQYAPASGGGPASNLVVQGTIPDALKAALEEHAKTSLEAKQGWAAGSSTVTGA